MIIYNVTVNVDYGSNEDWLKWMKEQHIPDVLATGLFFDAKLSKILAEEQGGKSYSIQYLSKSKKDYEQYQKEHAPRLQADHEKKFAGKYVAFRTLLDVVHHEKS
ncbi:MAG: DUF4286 family protein [Flavobacteriales bacterium]|nr:DUF4286 family protein [Flavobacteriales bacterium]